MYLSLLLLPMFGSAVAGLLGRKIGVTGAHIITCSCLITSAILAIVAFYEVGLCNSPVSINLISWIDSELMDVSWGFMFDSLTVSMLLPVLVVSSLVHIFSVDYMSADPHNQRFFAYLSMFTFFMLVLVTGDNYLIMFVGWEGIGISSYLLINFWFTRIQANKSAIKALVVNRVGDMFLSIGFFAIFFVFGNLDYSTVFSIAPFINETIITIIGLLLLLAAMGKSAQLGLHTWLPDAMEGPTPVSALIHAATLVTAGVYLLLRSSPVIEYGPTTLIIITWVGALTAFFAASTGLLQNDLKRVIAYSTCSQMGYLFMACGLSQYNVALFHLVNHAFFKALLFLAAGAVLHATYDQQDQRRLGGLIGFLPFTYTAILIGSLSLMALPWLTGFYSKDLILEVAYGQYEFSGQVAYWLGTLSACLTAFYSLRLISLTFLTYPNASKSVYLHTHDAPTIVMIPLIILSLLAIFFGYIARDLFVGMGSDFLSPSLFTHPSHISLIEAEFGLPQIIKLLPAIGTLMGAGLALYLYHILPVFTIDLTNNTLGQKLYRFFNGKYYIDVIYNHYIINGGLQLGYVISKVLDRGIIELVGPYGLATGLTSGSKDIAKLDTGNLTSYALYLAIALVTLVMILLSPVLLNAALINTPLILVLLAGTLCLPYVHYSNENKSYSPKSNKNSLTLDFVLSILFIYLEIQTDTFYCSNSLYGEISILSSVLIQSYNGKSKSFINILKQDFYIMMLKVFFSWIFVYFFIISILILIIFMGNPVHSSSESICNISSSDAVNSGLESTNTLSRESQNLDTVDSTRQILADTAGNVAREVVLHYPIETIAGIVAGTTMFKHVWNTTPGNSVYKGLVGLGMFAGAQGIVIGNEYLQNKYMTSISSSSSSISSSALTSSTSQNNNTETSSSQSLIDMANSYPIHSPNEEINSITILDSVNKFFLNWMQSTSGTKNRLPANIDMINWDTPLFFYSFYNFIIYTMYTALLYFVITIVVFYSLNYIWTNMKYLSCVEKVFTILSGGAANDFNKKIIEFMTSLMGKILMIVKAVLIYLFLIILVSSTYLYINYDFSSDLANHFNTTMKGVSNASTNFTMMYKVGDIETYYYQKFSEVILVLMIGIYRGYYLIRPLQYSSNIKAAIGFIVSLFVRSVTSFIMNVVLVGNVKTGITFIELFNAYNITINLVFYCVLSFLSLVVIEYILFKKIKVITMPKEKNKFNQKEGDSQDFYPYSLFYNILFIFMKVGTSLAFFGVFEGVLFLYTHYLPANVYYLCS